MDDAIFRTLDGMNAEGLLLSGMWGFEREALRVDAQGRLAATDHPFPPWRRDITVDFAENQAELVTAPRSNAAEALEELADLHREAYAAIGDEFLWPLSVPGLWEEPERLKPASFAGEPGMAEARRYRRYLAERYGLARQAISGVHFNFSFSRSFWTALMGLEGTAESARAFSDRRYLDLARNFLRYRFLPVFLFSASPSLDPRFEDELRDSSPGGARSSHPACAGRSASLRLGPLGYRLDPERGERIDIRFSSLSEYLVKLESAMDSTDGAEPLLRSASEYYAPVRLKSRPTGEKGSLAGLRENGIEYLELRIFDLDPFEPLGIGARAVAFTQAFVLACLLLPSPPLEKDAAADDELTYAASECSYDWMGSISGRSLRSAISEQSKDVFSAMDRIAPLLGGDHVRAVEWARGALVGKAPRSVERFARLALVEGGGRSAGLKLASEHKEAVMGAQRARKEAS